MIQSHVSYSLLLALLLSTLLLSACQQDPPPEVFAHITPTLQALKNMQYNGLQGDQSTITLSNGRWQGEPYEKGGASRPEVSITRNFHLIADLDADGLDEAITILNEDSGGSGQYSYLAVIKSVKGKLHNVATTLLGDRIQIKAAKVEKGQIKFEMVRAGKTDVACCPGEVVELGWNLTSQGLKEFSVLDTTQRLTPEIMAYGKWVLRSWDIDTAVDNNVKIDLKYDDGRLFGNSSCNNYFLQIKPKKLPGDISVGRIGSTRKACPKPIMTNESRFLKQLGGVNRFSFLMGQLSLSYKVGNTQGVMLFEKQL